MQEGWIKDFKFSVDKPEADKFMPKGGWSSVSPPVSPWTVSTQAPVVQAYQSDENLKKQYGIELAKSANPFEAGCKLFGEETNKALWVSFNWVHDPIVVASKDVYEKTVAISTPLLDREQLAAKVLALSEEKILKNGVYYPVVEAKDRIAALKLYSDIAGYTGKVEIDNSKNLTINEIAIKLVKPENSKPVIEQAPNVKSEMANENAPPITLKLVGGVSR